MTTVRAFLAHYESIRKRTKRLLKTIPPEHMDFAYKEGKFTIADHIRHIAAVERYMFAETLSGKKNLYRCCGKGLVDGYVEVIAFFDKLHDETISIISSLSDKDMEEDCLTPTGVAIRKDKWLMLLAEHEIHHRAQLYLYLNILAIKTPPMYGLTSEELSGL